jgi:hypothetical protein
MKHIKLFEQFAEAMLERETSVERPDLIEKYSKFKTLTIDNKCPIDDNGIPAKGIMDQNFPKLSSASSAGVINAGTHPIVKVTLPPFHLKIGKKTAKAGLVSIYLKDAGPYNGCITATEEWFDENVKFN